MSERSGIARFEVEQDDPICHFGCWRPLVALHLFARWRKIAISTRITLGLKARGFEPTPKLFGVRDERASGDVSHVEHQAILEWLKEAGAYAFQFENPERPGGRILVDLPNGRGTVGVRVRRASQQEYRCLTWSEIERAEANPLLPLIDETINTIR
jgi:hypothetical protein